MVLGLVDAAAKQRVRLARESVYGVVPAAPVWRQLNDVKVMPKPQFESDPFKPSAYSVPSLVVLNDEFTNADVSGRMSYTGLLFVLSSLLGDPITTARSGSTVEHEWSWNGVDELFPVSYSVDYGTGRRSRRFTGGVFNTLSLGVGRGGLDFSSGMFGKSTEIGTQLGGMVNEEQTVDTTGATGGTFTLSFLGSATAPIAYNATAAAVQAALEALSRIGAGNITVTGGPLPGAVTVQFTGRYAGRDVAILTSDATALVGGAVGITETVAGADLTVDVPAVPVFPLHFDVFCDDSWAAMEAETTQLRALYNLGFELGDRFARTNPVDSSRASDALVENEDQSHTSTLRLGADATADAFMSTIRNGANKFVRAKATGPNTGDAGENYQLTIDESLLLTGTDGYDSESGVHVMTWSSVIARDGVSGNALRIRLRNRLTM